MNWTVKDSRGCHVPIQHDLRDRPFWVLAACLLLNQSKGDPVKKVLDVLLQDHPEPRDIAQMDPGELERILRPVGLQTRKRTLLQEMAWDFTKKGAPKTAKEVLYYRGCGTYARDAYAIFVLGERPGNPADHVLRQWLEDNK
jgi:endonuclease III